MNKEYSVVKYFGLAIVLAMTSGYFLYTQKNICESPIQYKIGTFDNRFGISQKDFLQAVSQASEIWGEPIGKTLFEYNPKGDLVINLIYDSRQKTTQKNATLKADANKINDLANSVKQQYLVLEDHHSLLEKEYSDMVAVFNQHQDTYNTQVTYWNNNGGAPKNEYAKLTSQKEALIMEQSILEGKRIEVNSVVEQINTFIHKYNLLVNDANANINTINLSAGKEFEEGIYDPSENKIDIYEFSSNQKLIRVLTHELGHALDLSHNDNPKSIMYSLNQANTLTLSKDDLEALKSKCHID